MGIAKHPEQYDVETFDVVANAPTAPINTPGRDAAGNGYRSIGTGWIQTDVNGAASVNVQGTGTGFVLPTANLALSNWAMGDASNAITILAAANANGNALDLRKVDYKHASLLMITSNIVGVVTTVSLTVEASFDNLWTAGQVWSSSALTEVSGAAINANGAYLFELADVEFPFMNYMRPNIAVADGTSMDFQLYLMARGLA